MDKSVVEGCLVKVEAYLEMFRRSTGVEWSMRLLQIRNELMNGGLIAWEDTPPITFNPFVLIGNFSDAMFSLLAAIVISYDFGSDTEVIVESKIAAAIKQTTDLITNLHIVSGASHYTREPIMPLGLKWFRDAGFVTVREEGVYVLDREVRQWLRQVSPGYQAAQQRQVEAEDLKLTLKFLLQHLQLIGEITDKLPASFDVYIWEIVPGHERLLASERVVKVGVSSKVAVAETVSDKTVFADPLPIPIPQTAATVEELLAQAVWNPMVGPMATAFITPETYLWCYDGCGTLPKIFASEGLAGVVARIDRLIYAGFSTL
jgi:hypothetical protein